MVDVVRALQGDTLDLLLWRERGLTSADLGPVRDANPGLAALEPILPLGTAVIVPATSSSASAPTLPLIQLWD